MSSRTGLGFWKSRATAGSTLKDGLLAWYDFNDATDSHGIFDLVVTGSPSYGAGYVDTDSSNYFTTPDGLCATDPPAFMPNTNSDGTLITAFQSLGSTGLNHIAKASNRHFITFSPTANNSPTVEISNYSHAGSQFPGNMQQFTDYIVTAKATGAPGLMERFVDGTAYGSTTGGTFIKPGMEMDLGREGTMRLYWIALWERAITADEISSPQLTSTSTTYADL